MGRQILRWFKYLLVISIPGGIAALLAVELVFRFAIPASNPPHSFFDEDNRVLKLDAAGPRTGSISVGAFARQRSKWRVNNMGWNSEIDYVADGRSRPLIAIIGDSFVQALDVDVQDNLASQLRRRVNGRYDVYSFAKGGAALSQYLHLSRYVNRNFDPEILVFNVVANDFDQSLCDVSRPVGMMCLRDAEGELQESNIVPYVPSRVQRWARRSSLIRYVVFNLKISPAFRRPGGLAQTQPGAAPDETAEQLRRDRIERSTSYILGKIAGENPGKRVIFMIDGPRRLIYQGNLDQRDDFELWTNGLLERKAKEQGFSFIDLMDHFSAAFKEDGVMFESKDDYHWNDHGHAVAADALLETLIDSGAIRR